VCSDELGPAFRRAGGQDEPFLRRMGWIAVHWRTPDPPPLNPVVSPELSRYTEGFGGRNGDRGVVAGCGRGLVGAAWCRLLTKPNEGFGYVADDVPELSVAVLPDYRNRGVGRKLIDSLLLDAADDFEAISLSVEPDNPAFLLYKRLGFHVIGGSGGSLTMIKWLIPPPRRTGLSAPVRAEKQPSD
jgi:GNAT superfamily N-acetyltransferase